MCFSASVSFAASVVLLSIGVYCVRTAWQSDKVYVPFACLPLAFGVQQAFEGGVWLGLNTNTASLVSIASLGFLFFSHGFWLGWIPFAALFLEFDRTLKRILGVFTCLGTLYGVLLYIPLLIDLDRVAVKAVNGSIYYQLSLIFGNWLPGKSASLLYTLVILVPLLISSHRPINVFGGLISLSVIWTFILFNYAFISVWCFFAALLSLYIVYTLHRITQLEPKQSVA